MPSDNPLATHCEPSALYCWILEIRHCTPKGRRALLRVPSTEGRGIRLCWALSKPKELKRQRTPALREESIHPEPYTLHSREKQFLTNNLLVRIHFIIEMVLVDRPCAMAV